MTRDCSPSVGAPRTGAEPSGLRLDSTYGPTGGRAGGVRLRLVNAGPTPVSVVELCLSSFVGLTPVDEPSLALVGSLGTHHRFAPRAPVIVPSGGTWAVGLLRCAYPLARANDGPVAAAIVDADGVTRPVAVVPTDRAPAVPAGGEPPPALYLRDGDAPARQAWAAMAAVDLRLHPDGGPVLRHGDGSVAVDAHRDEGLGPEQYAIEPGSAPTAGSTDWLVTGGSAAALGWAFAALARQHRAGGAHGGTSRPRHRFRGVMVDLARHFHPAEDVEEIIDQAAWRGLNRVHLHLTDDNGWRVPITGYPELVEIGAWRGPGHPIPPLGRVGTGTYGGWYSRESIWRWVQRAASLGVELVPEIDVPGHCFAALAALPVLRDPAAAGVVRSVHNFPSNALDPGVAATWTFLERVLGEVADLFPGPSLHVGGDEVADGAWDRSPAATAYAARHGLTGHREVEAAFVAGIVALVRGLGRTPGVWQEAALSGGLRPGEGYVVGWTSREVCRVLAEAGHDVVASPAEAFYLDMGEAPGWYEPGMSWAGTVTADTIAAFDVEAGWPASARANLLGVQACLWGEHVADRATLRRLLLPRLDAFAAGCWTGDEPAGLSGSAG